MTAALDDHDDDEYRTFLGKLAQSSDLMLREQAHAELLKVGPKGYEHGWRFVGVPSIGPPNTRDNSWTRTRNNAEATIAASIASGEASHKPLLGGHMGDVDLVTFNDGNRAVRKIPKSEGEWATLPPQQQADAEELASMVASAFEVRAPAVHRTGPTELYMDYVEHPAAITVALDVRARVEQQRSVAGTLLGLFDLAINNDERSGNNYHIDLDTEEPIAIDHALAWFNPANRDDDGAVIPPVWAQEDLFTKPFVTNDGRWAPNIMYWADIATIQRRLDTLRPHFARLDRRQWFDDTVDRLAAIRANAIGRNSILGGSWSS